jgi:hypothetical protein
MESAERRGLRLESNEITKRIIQEIWKPSELIMTKPSEGKPDGNSQHGSKCELNRALSSDEQNVRQAILKILGNDEALLNAKAFRNHVKTLDAAKRKTLQGALDKAAGCASESGDELAKKRTVLGRIFDYHGKKTKPTNEIDYGKQVSQWLSQSIFSANNKKVTP